MTVPVLHLSFDVKGLLAFVCLFVLFSLEGPKLVIFRTYYSYCTLGWLRNHVRCWWFNLPTYKGIIHPLYYFSSSIKGIKMFLLSSYLRFVHSSSNSNVFLCSLCFSVYGLVPCCCTQGFLLVLCSNEFWSCSGDHMSPYVLGIKLGLAAFKARF